MLKENFSRIDWNWFNLSKNIWELTASILVHPKIFKRMENATMLMAMGTTMSSKVKYLLLFVFINYYYFYYRGSVYNTVLLGLTNIGISIAITPLTISDCHNTSRSFFRAGMAAITPLGRKIGQKRGVGRNKTTWSKKWPVL